ncbi:MAG: hypothetical protein JO069_15140 [Verrucomicrobia bacterium]|nr:hypothetical protein [Verrucomicrobiota bacterium]
MFRAWVIAATLLVLMGVALAEDINYDQVPEAVRRTVEQNRGAGEVQPRVEVFPFANVKLYRVQIALGGEPVREIEVAETGKLIRIDELRKPAAGAEDDDDDSGGE